MSIASQITRINTNISNSYTAVDNKNGTLPQVQNSANLASAIDSIEVIEQATAEGESLNLANTKAMPYSDYVVEGKSEQEAGKTKNLLNSLGLTTQTINGVTFTPVYENNSLQYININGTATDRADYKFVNYVTYNPNTYDLQKINTNSGISALLVTKNGSVVKSASATKVTFTITENTGCLCWIRIYSGITINNEKIYPQVKLSSITDDTYEPYGEKPSPSIPSEIHSVADDVNLLENMTIYNSNHYISPLLKLNPGTYTFNYTGDSAPGIYIRKNDGSNPTNGTVVDQKYTANNITFSISETGNYYIHLYSSTIWEQLTMNNPKLQKGTIATPYSPYNQGTVTIKQRGKNLWDEEWEIGKYETNINSSNFGKPVATTDQIRGKNYISIEPNTTYFGYYGASLGSMFVLCYDKDYNPITSWEYKNMTNASITTPINARYIRFYCTAGYGTTYNNNIAIIKGTSGTYEAYQGYSKTIQTEPLRSLPNGVKDTIEADGIHRRVGRIVLDGTENWTSYTVLQNNIAQRGITLSPKAKSRIGYCNNFPVVADYSSTEHIVIAGGLTAVYIHIDQTRLNTQDLAGFKTWLSNNPVEVIYELAEEIIEPLTQNQATTMLDIIKTGSYEGTTNIYTDEDVKPTIGVGYYKKG